MNFRSYFQSKLQLATDQKCILAIARPIKDCNILIFKVIKIEPKTDSDDYLHRVRTSDEEPENPIENLNNYDLEEITGGRVHATQESTMDEEQKDTPQLGTSSGAATQVDTWNNAISIQNGLVI